ncbi:RNA polymerase sigma factor [Pyxidicoccus parkwayensis]|uniref:RNA polymerase sigma factor n=1 Tax=Pyxidicoccus parkwayensis TaxID=2813578 RepID=A0ABX7P6I5_9BACT|nr:RNA polymerase sigma factor [Pyxidicoccus parkwaysis]QSQ26109.1 RNA polymerase sigma factor [Pyxidicoccus parkwaysis]
MSRADSQQLSQLFNQHGPRVYRRALRLLGNPADAEEATQEIFIRAFKGAEGFRQQSQLTTWLYQIATHYCLNLIRDRSRRAELYAEHMPAAGDAEERTEPVRPDDLVLLRRLIADADEKQASAAVYVFLDGMSHEEAAEVLGVSKRTVGNLLERFQAWAAARTALATEAPAANNSPPERKASGFFGFGRRRS